MSPKNQPQSTTIDAQPNHITTLNFETGCNLAPHELLEMVRHKQIRPVAAWVYLTLNAMLRADPEGPRTVTDIADKAGICRNVVIESRHELEAVGLIQCVREERTGTMYRQGSLTLKYKDVALVPQTITCLVKFGKLTATEAWGAVVAFYFIRLRYEKKHPLAAVFIGNALGKSEKTGERVLDKLVKEGLLDERGFERRNGKHIKVYGICGVHTHEIVRDRQEAESTKTDERAVVHDALVPSLSGYPFYHESEAPWKRRHARRKPALRDVQMDTRPIAIKPNTAQLERIEQAARIIAATPLEFVEAGIPPFYHNYYDQHPEYRLTLESLQDVVFAA